MRASILYKSCVSATSSVTAYVMYLLDTNIFKCISHKVVVISSTNFNWIFDKNGVQDLQRYNSEKCGKFIEIYESITKLVGGIDKYINIGS